VSLVEELEPLPGFRNVLVHDYVSLNLDRVVKAPDRLASVEPPPPRSALSGSPP